MDTSKYFRKIDSLSRRTDSGSIEGLTEGQKELYECLRGLFGKTTNSHLKRKFIREQCKGQVDTEARGTFISDFCYNLVNLEDSENKFLIRSEPGLYSFVDFDWQADKELQITWTFGKDALDSPPFLNSCLRSGFELHYMV